MNHARFAIFYRSLNLLAQREPKILLSTSKTSLRAAFDLFDHRAGIPRQIMKLMIARLFWSVHVMMSETNFSASTIAAQSKNK
jgi:hypothetical protein